MGLDGHASVVLHHAAGGGNMDWLDSCPQPIHEPLPAAHIVASDSPLTVFAALVLGADPFAQVRVIPRWRTLIRAAKWICSAPLERRLCGCVCHVSQLQRAMLLPSGASTIDRSYT